MGLRETIKKSLSVSGNYQNESLLIASIIISEQTQGRRQRTYLTLMEVITKELFIPVIDSTIPVLILEIQRSSPYGISQSLLLQLLLLDVRLKVKFDWRERVIPG